MVGQQVWLYHPAVPKGRAPKLWIPWRGPFKVVECVSDNVYGLATKTGERLKSLVSVNRLQAFHDRASWPSHEVSDQQDHKLLDIPDDSDPMCHEVLGVPAEIQEVIDERWVPRKSGVQREFRVRMKSRTGRLSEKWLNERKIMAGDLIYLYRSKRFDEERAKDLQVDEGGTMMWEKTNSSGVNGVLHSDLEGMPSMGMLSWSVRNKANLEMRKSVDSCNRCTVGGSPSSDAKDSGRVEESPSSDDKTHGTKTSVDKQPPPNGPLADEKIALPPVKRGNKPLTAEKDGFGRESQVTKKGGKMLKWVYKTQVYNHGKKGALNMSLCEDEKAYKSPMKPYKSSMKRIFETKVGVRAYKMQSELELWSSTLTGGGLANIAE